MADENKMKAFGRLLDIMDDLREKCPWDKKQTMDSLRNLTLEETYELADAIIENDMQAIKEELGDVMLHLVFYAKIADEQNEFDIADAIHEVCEKLIRRHPHIYGDLEINDPEVVKQNWEKLKMNEGKKSVLSGVPNGLPSIIKAYRMQDKTAQVGFEWDETSQVWEKVEEEMGELQEAIAKGDKAHIEEEFGDVIFALVNYARFLKIDPDLALEKVNKKFKNRFEYIERNSRRPLTEMNLDEMNALWEEAKKEKTF